MRNHFYILAVAVLTLGSCGASTENAEIEKMEAENNRKIKEIEERRNQNEDKLVDAIEKGTDPDSVSFE